MGRYVGLYFLVPIIFISLVPIANAAGPSTNFNPCSTMASGFKGIDSTNYVNYVECLGYQVIQSYECAEGFYFDEQIVQCVVGTWVDPEEDLSTQADNVCISVYDGFVAIDASVYAICFNFVETGRYSCPEGFYFDEGQQQCIDEDTSLTATAPATADSTEVVSTPSESSEEASVSLEKTVGTSCENVQNGKIALPSLQGWLVCNNGEVLVTEYCGASKLYNIDYEVCVNYCEGRSNNSSDTISQVLLPKLSGQVTCDDTTGMAVKNIVCSPGTHFDAQGYCRNFCEVGQTQQYISFPEQQGGVSCQEGNVIAVEWCDPGSIYSTIIGVCMKTDSPSLSPITANPTTLSPITGSPTIPIMTASPTFTATIPPTLEVDKPPKPALVDIEDSGGFAMLNSESVKSFMIVRVVVTVVLNYYIL